MHNTHVERVKNTANYDHGYDENISRRICFKYLFFHMHVEYDDITVFQVHHISAERTTS